MEESHVAKAYERVKALKLPQNTAGHHLIYQVPLAYTRETVGQAKQRLLAQMRNYKSINYVFVLSENQTLRGVLSFKELFIQDPDKRISNVMNSNLVFSQPHVDQERVAHLALKHNIKSVPIVDEKKRFIGIVPSDQILKILFHEHKEDMLKSVGIITDAKANGSNVKISIINSYLRRVPWILVGLTGGMLVASVVGIFADTLKENLILATFIPLLVYVSAAVGTQTQTLYIRDLAFNEKISVIAYALREAFVVSLIAITSGLMIATMIAIFWQEAGIGLVVGLAATVSIVFSVFIAISVPYLLGVFKQDPANGSGPFATILQDSLSVIIYFSITSLML